MYLEPPPPALAPAPALSTRVLISSRAQLGRAKQNRRADVGPEMPDNLSSVVDDVVTGRVAVRAIPEMDQGFRGRPPVWVSYTEPDAPPQKRRAPTTPHGHFAEGAAARSPITPAVSEKARRAAELVANMRKPSKRARKPVSYAGMDTGRDPEWQP